MKRSIPFLFLMFVLALTGCKKDDDATPSAAANQLVLSADGKNITFSANQMNVVAYGSSGSYDISIQGVSSSALFQLHVTDAATATGDFKLSEDVYISYMPVNTSGETYSSDECGKYTGSVKVTEFDTQNKVISGSFSGTVCDGTKEKTVSGSFNKLKY